jgi:hypothetical protein
MKFRNQIVWTMVLLFGCPSGSTETVAGPAGCFFPFVPWWSHGAAYRYSAYAPSAYTPGYYQAARPSWYGGISAPIVSYSSGYAALSQSMASVSCCDPCPPSCCPPGCSSVGTEDVPRPSRPSRDDSPVPRDTDKVRTFPGGNGSDKGSGYEDESDPVDGFRRRTAPKGDSETDTLRDRSRRDSEPADIDRRRDPLRDSDPLDDPLPDRDPLRPLDNNDDRSLDNDRLRDRDRPLPDREERPRSDGGSNMFDDNPPAGRPGIGDTDSDTLNPVDSDRTPGIVPGDRDSRPAEPGVGDSVLPQSDRTDGSGDDIRTGRGRENITEQAVATIPSQLREVIPSVRLASRSVSTKPMDASRFAGPRQLRIHWIEHQRPDGSGRF